MNKLELSIIILSYNTRDTTLACIDSIYKYQPKSSYEVIVVDNASTDGSIEAFTKYKKIANFHLIKSATNVGFSKGNNLGINKSSGDYKLLLNSDTVIKDSSIDKLLQFAKKHEDAGVVGSRLLNKDGSIQPSVFRLPTLGRTLKQYWFGQKGLLDKYAPNSNQASDVESVVGAVFMITPSAIDKVGLLDERYFMFFEDLDYCRRVANAHLKIYYYPTAEIFHLHGASGAKLSNSANQWRRLVPSSKIYHGLVAYYLIYLVMWVNQKWGKYVR